MNTKIIYTAGYSAGWTHESMETVLRDRDAVILDIRLKPWSRLVDWRQDNLRARFRDRYFYSPYLGNKNYQGGPITLANPIEGMRQLRTVLQRTNAPAVVLLCGCRDAHTCHRSTVATMAVQQLGGLWDIQIEHLDPPASTAPGWKCLSVRQPWAWSIVCAMKDIENRDWTTNYRGPLLIHAAKGMTRAEYAAYQEFITERFGGVGWMPAFPELIARGGIFGAVRVVDCVRAHSSPWFTGPVGLVLEDPQLLPFLPLRGQLGIFTVSDAQLEPIAPQLAELKQLWRL